METPVSEPPTGAGWPGPLLTAILLRLILGSAAPSSPPKATGLPPAAPPAANTPPAAPAPTAAGIRRARKILKDDKIPDTAKQPLADAALGTQPTPDSSTYRIIIGALAGIAVLTTLAVFFLTWAGKDTQTTTTQATRDAPASTVTTSTTAPELFLSLGSAAVGALAGVVTGQRLNASTTAGAAGPR